MKIREGYVLNEIENITIAIYIGEDEENGLHGIVKLNKSGAFMWKKLTEGCTKEKLVIAVMEQYGVDKGTASKDVDMFVNLLRSENILEEVTGVWQDRSLSDQ